MFTWKEFKELLEENGVTDNMFIDFIEIHRPAKISVEVKLNEKEHSFSVSY